MKIKKNGKTLGVLGGMGPMASAEFINLLYKKSPAIKDQEHPAVVMISDTKIPDRSVAILDSGVDPSEKLIENFKKLDILNVDFYAVPCNTSHYFIDKFIDELKHPVIHIVDATINEMSSRDFNDAWLLCTRGTVESNLYQKHSENSCINFHIPSHEIQEIVHKIIYSIKANNNTEAYRLLCEVMIKLVEINKIPIVLGCTELPIVYKSCFFEDVAVISCLDALVTESLKKLYDNY